jgi:hypothetical protein
LFFDGKLDLGALRLKQCIDRLFGELDRVVLGISGRRRPKTIGFGARDVLAIQAPKVSKPSSGLIFESFNQVAPVFHSTFSLTRLAIIIA